MVLRAKLDMANPNMHFRDPIMYRIIHTPHHRTGTQWNAYPMYDFAHGQSDYFEGVTHSICTLEFVPHRPLYDKFIDFLKEMNGEEDKMNDFRPRQIEFNRLNLTNTVMSKRKLHTLVDEGLVAGWDDPRMPTLCGMRRRGYSPESIRMFIDSIGYTKFDALNDMALLEAAVRDDLNKRACRVNRRDGNGEQSRKPCRRKSQHHLLEVPLDGTRRLYGRCAKEVLQNDTWTGSATQKRIYREVYWLHQRC